MGVIELRPGFYGPIEEALQLPGGTVRWANGSFPGRLNPHSVAGDSIGKFFNQSIARAAA